MKSSTKKRFEENKKKMDFYNQDGTEHQPNSNTNKKFYMKKRKIKPISYTYTSNKPYNAFFDVLTVMTKSCKNIDNFIKEHTTHEEEERLYEDYDYAISILSNAVMKNLPQLIANRNIHTSISVSANKIHVRLESGIAFTLETKYQIVDKIAEIVSCTGTITLYDKNDNLINDLLDNGFELIDRK